MNLDDFFTMHSKELNEYLPSDYSLYSFNPLNARYTQLNYYSPAVNTFDVEYKIQHYIDENPIYVKLTFRSNYSTYNIFNIIDAQLHEISIEPSGFVPTPVVSEKVGFFRYCVNNCIKYKTLDYISFIRTINICIGACYGNNKLKFSSIPELLEFVNKDVQMSKKIREMEEDFIA